MVTVQDIGLQLTKPVRELAQWNFPFAQTLEQYCSLFNTTCNKSFGDAGLVLQNSTAVYVHRLDSLWTEVEYCRDTLSTQEQEEATKNPTKKRDRKMTDVCFHKFKTVNFAEDVDKHIDIKKNHIAHESVKSKSRRFTQLEKSIAHVSIDIYDVNGEVIGKKYDFRCNQNLSMDDTLVDEFAPQDFYCGDVSVKEKSSSNSYRLSCDTSAELDSIIHNNNNENVNTFSESEGDNNSPEEEISDLTMSLELRQQNLSLSRNTATDNTLVKTPTNISGDNCHDVTLMNTLSQTFSNTPPPLNSPILTNIDNTILLNNDLKEQCLNTNINESIDVGSILDSPPESVNSKGRRISSTDDLAMLNDTNGDLTQTNSCIDSVKNTPLNESKKIKTRRQCSALKFTPKLLKRNLHTSCKKQQSIIKKNLHILKNSSSKRNRSSMFNKNLRSCMKYIQEYDPLRYEELTNAESDLLGFRLHTDTIESNTYVNADVTTNVDGNITPSTDMEISKLHSPMDISPNSPHETFCDVWFRSDSHFLSETVDQWHEIMQPKLCDAEQRSTFCIRDYASRIMDTLKTSDQRRINFDDVFQKESSYEVARYFLASLDLAAKQNIDINTNKDPEHNIEIAIHTENGHCSDSQADSHD